MSTKTNFGRTILSYLEIVLFALILSWGLRSVVVEASVIPTPSMLPTIQLQDRVIVDKLLFKLSEIERGDIIVFHPLREVDESGVPWIKRIIALPGEKVEIKGGIVIINGTELSEPYELEKPDYTFEEIIVPENSYFVLGDNRNNSNDSHKWGVLPAENIIGKASLRYWPLNRFGYLAR
ncbi:signal peptidase I [Desulfosporosinus fructosivorans]|uniref:Signal peptidase I n=1 Tax=Desulfosporosinus fructosivorans TaxID=2018669 RepID=A0A4Z0R0T3_9FIRM|nr:signal peptidase I [Desulfosporosinus fructosivorans]TGE36139.1 signal peptidase I [Desulfosporosinus fructosivorans]